MRNRELAAANRRALARPTPEMPDLPGTVPTVMTLEDQAAAASEAWEQTYIDERERWQRYVDLRRDGIRGLELAIARMRWGVAHVSAAQMWVERCAAIDRLDDTELPEPPEPAA